GGCWPHLAGFPLVNTPLAGIAVDDDGPGVRRVGVPARGGWAAAAPARIPGLAFGPLNRGARRLFSCPQTPQTPRTPHTPPRPARHPRPPPTEPSSATVSSRACT